MIVSAKLQDPSSRVTFLSGEYVLVGRRQLVKWERKRVRVVKLRIRRRIPRELNGGMAPAVDLPVRLVQGVKHSQVNVGHRLKLPDCEVALVVEDNGPRAPPLHATSPVNALRLVALNNHQVHEPEETLQSVKYGRSHQTPLVDLQPVARRVYIHRILAIVRVLSLHQRHRVAVHHRARERGEDPQKKH